MAYYASSSPERPNDHPSLTISEPSSPSYCSHIDDASFLSTDLDVSFASVSVNSEPSTPNEDVTSILSHGADAMDISPAVPRTRPVPIRRRSNTIDYFSSATTHAETRDRAFGKEVSNTSPSINSPPRAPIMYRCTQATPDAPPVPSLLGQTSATSKASSSSRQRGGLPSAWLMPGKPVAKSRGKRAGGIFGGQVDLADSSFDKSFSDAMDVDTSARKPPISSSAFVTSSPPAPAADDSLGSLFFGSNSPVEGLILNKKRRSQDREDSDQENIDRHPRRNSGGSGSRKCFRSSSPGSSPSAKRTSIPVPRRLERFATTGGTGSLLFGGISKPVAGKRNGMAMKRPGISALVQPTESTIAKGAPKSAYPGLYGPSGRRMPSSMSTMPPPRRAFSAAQVPPKLVTTAVQYDSPGEPDLETEPEDESFQMSSPAPPPKKAGPFRSVSYANAPLTAAPGVSMFQKLQQAMGVDGHQDDSTIHGGAMQGSLPGCRDSETDGKILPCFPVKEDGIVRITPETMDDLLGGMYDDDISELHIIDCRFDYEFEGGHINGACNITTSEQLDSYFFKDVTPPPPSQSGEFTGETSKTVIIFHCEFSAKRGPTLAKHLRSQDRKQCTDVYPKVHYPEVYVLQGGYKAYYDSFPTKCTGYTEMDDPKHIGARREKIDNLRKWERTKSYTYGDRMAATSALSSAAAASTTSSSSKKAKSHPLRPASTSVIPSFALGKATRPLELATLAEHHEDLSFTSDADSSFGAGIGDSPCASKFATSRPLTAGKRAPLDRATTMAALNFGFR